MGLKRYKQSKSYNKARTGMMSVDAKVSFTYQTKIEQIMKIFVCSGRKADLVLITYIIKK
jgi:hypothetical protein